MSRFVLGLLLLVVWLLLWGEVTAANVISGAVTVGVIYLVFPSRRHPWPRRVFHPIGVLHLFVYFAAQLVLSSLLIARAVFVRRSRLTQTVVDVPMRITNEPLLTLIITIIALTPGSISVAARRDPPTIGVHVLVVGDPSAVLASVHRLEELCVRAFGSATVRAELKEHEAT